MIYHLYGYTGTDIDSYKDVIEKILNISMQGRESFYWGEYYMFKDDQRSFQLFQNWEDMENDYMHPEFSDYKILLSAYVDDNLCIACRALLEKVPNLIFLK